MLVVGFSHWLNKEWNGISPVWEEHAVGFQPLITRIQHRVQHALVEKAVPHPLGDYDVHLVHWQFYLFYLRPRTIHTDTYRYTVILVEYHGVLPLWFTVHFYEILHQLIYYPLLIKTSNIRYRTFFFNLAELKPRFIYDRYVTYTVIAHWMIQAEKQRFWLFTVYIYSIYGGSASAQTADRYDQFKNYVHLCKYGFESMWTNFCSMCLASYHVTWF